MLCVLEIIFHLLRIAQGLPHNGQVLLAPGQEEGQDSSPTLSRSIQVLHIFCRYLYHVIGRYIPYRTRDLGVALNDRLMRRMRG
ncbi:hypothetical protein EDB85DRAFT_699469 [Lactarius pseudohatsudake]|nr:hypothetical protein EDB85DRAFT_699469 [Lactarius pseudohatsudake]